MIALAQQLPDSFFLLVRLFPILTILPVIGFFLYFLKKLRKTNYLMYKYLTFLFGASILNHLFSILSFFAVESETAIFYFLVGQFFDLTSLLTVMVLLTVFQQQRAISGNQIVLTSLIAGILGIITTEGGVEVLSSESPWLIGFSRDTLIPVLVMLFSVIATLNLIYVYRKSYKTVSNPTQKDLLRLLFAGIIISQLLGSFVPHLGIALFPSILAGWGEFFLFPLFAFVKIGGLILVGYAFHRVGKHPWLMQQQRNHFLMVYNPAGIALYTKSFRKDISEDDMSLFSGAFSAISTVIEESTKISESIKAIHFDEKELHVISRETFICILMMDFSTKASFQAQKEFTHEFEAKFLQQLTNFTGNVTKFKQADELVRKYFS